MPSPTGKAWIACLLFALVGIVGWTKTGSGTTESFPLLLFYGVLLVNTFFSIRAFSAITPANSIQIFFDAILVVVYCALAFSFGSAFLFSFVSGVLFVVSIAKYFHLKHLITLSSGLLQRKIKINALGALLSLFAFSVAAAGFSEAAAWILSAIFVLANIYLLAINPMYRADS
ncbi:hypothetical protein A3A39_04550 [Candidatus Kaiserbacteria bacterium RIFCSPLOWO2_01_FULL_54_13]|uniref:Uncharacterized protein n=1 Tax=Candidatus Kaiserbacteria bacterium RIFCSPLOWO2_01_FULL_54_13 TaxID=1798512 RepID=A0A1F6F1N9_9BACT|nr:MAG: hypothetical protein A3A39_04550 [Candidatus Kaiserbacteria bacterium RIFCSPLOWO2_01_FULL_54_13]